MATVAVLAAGTFGLLGAANAEAVALHALTSAGCISDLEGVDTCGAGNETQGLNGVNDVAISPDGTSVYVTSGTDDAIARFNRGAGGTLTPAGCISDLEGADTCGAGNEAQGLSGARSVVVSPDGASVYVASGTDNAIARFNRGAGGTLTPAGCISDLEGADTCGAGNEAQGLGGASDVAVSPDGSSVYVASRTDDGIARFNRVTGGAITAAGCFDDVGGAAICGAGNEAQGLNAAESVTVAPDGASAYVASTDDDAIARFNRGAGGTLTPAGCISDTDGADTCGAGNEAQGLDDAFDVVVSPDGASTYVASLADNAIVRFNRAADGALSAVGCIDDVGGAAVCGAGNETQGLSGARGLAASPDGASVFVASDADSSIVRFTRSADGALTAGACLDVVGGPAICGAGNEAQGILSAEAVAASPDGTSVYATSTGDDAIVRFNREVPPTCLGTAAAGPPGQPVTVPLDCVDPNGDALAIQLLDSPANGTLGAVNQAADTVTYAPNLGFTGNDAFSFRAISDGKQSNIATAHIDIEPPQGQTGPQGPAGSQGPAGTQGPAGEAAIKLLALLSSDKLSGKSGKKLSIRYVSSARGDATATVKKGSKGVADATGTATGAGADKLSLTLKDGKKKLAKGNYTLQLDVEGADGQTATDSARLKVK